MNIIKLNRYLPEMSALFSFYSYCEFTFADPTTQRKLEDTEFESMYETALPFLEDSPVPTEELPARLEEIVRQKVADDISNGLETLRRQIVQTAHSIFEKFLCHIVRVYFHTFPEILKDIEKSISFREIVEIKENDRTKGCMVNRYSLSTCSQSVIIVQIRIPHLNFSHFKKE